jgi:hypothetical protein
MDEIEELEHVNKSLYDRIRATKSFIEYDCSKKYLQQETQAQIKYRYLICPETNILDLDGLKAYTKKVARVINSYDLFTNERQVGDLIASIRKQWLDLPELSIVITYNDAIKKTVQENKFSRLFGVEYTEERLDVNVLFNFKIVPSLQFITIADYETSINWDTYTQTELNKLLEKKNQLLEEKIHFLEKAINTPTVH